MAPRRITLRYAPLDELQRAPRNPKLHDDPGIAASVREHGFVEPVLIDERTERLVGGHGRLDVLESMQAAGDPPPEFIVVERGVWKVPVVRGWSSLDDVDAEALLVGLNQLGAAAGWDREQLSVMLDELRTSGRDLLSTGYRELDVDAMLAEFRVPDVDDLGPDSQPRLDEARMVKCPECGHRFDAAEHADA